MPDFSKMPLGKKAAFFPPLTPKFASLILPTDTPLPPVPATVDYTTRVATWPMFDNDTLGDCAIATVGHMIQLYTSYTRPTAEIMTIPEIIEFYELAGGYNPANPATDQGCVISDVLRLWNARGVSVGGYMDRISGFIRVDPLVATETKYSLWWFGAVYIGVQLPIAWQTAHSWDLPANLLGDNAPGSWGGHAIPIVAYDADGVTVITWGEKMKMSWAAMHAYCDESWAVISPDFINQQGVTPANFDWAYLLASMKRIREHASDFTTTVAVEVSTEVDITVTT